MKTLKLLQIVIFALTCIAITSCVEKKTPEAPSADKLVGTWKSVWSEYWYKDSSSPDENEEWNKAIPDEEAVVLTFNKDYTGTDNDMSDFTWELNRSKLTIYTADESEVSIEEEVTVLKITDDELFLENHSKEDTWEEYSKITLKRQ